MGKIENIKKKFGLKKDNAPSKIGEESINSKTANIETAQKVAEIISEVLVAAKNEQIISISGKAQQYGREIRLGENLVDGTMIVTESQVAATMIEIAKILRLQNPIQRQSLSEVEVSYTIDLGESNFTLVAKNVTGDLNVEFHYCLGLIDNKQVKTTFKAPEKTQEEARRDLYWTLQRIATINERGIQAQLFTDLETEEALSGYNLRTKFLDYLIGELPNATDEQIKEIYLNSIIMNGSFYLSVNVIGHTPKISRISVGGKDIEARIDISRQQKLRLEDKLIEAISIQRRIAAEALETERIVN